MPKSERFATLDGMRGVAALIVASCHILAMLGARTLPHADLAVDFFFVLSGFVLAHSYEGRLGSSMTPAEFLKRRLIRLHPLILLGSSIPFLALLTRSLLGGGERLGDILLAGGAAILFIPYHGLDWRAAFPLNGPAWSLFAEYAANIVFALTACSLSSRRLAGILVCGLLMLVLLVAIHGTVGNVWSADTIGFSLLRVVYPFFAGVLISRIYRSGRLSTNLPSWVPLFFLVAILSAPASGFDAAFELVSITILFPLLVLVAARDSWGPAGTRLMLLGGALSYPVYMLHFPIAVAFIPPLVRSLGKGATVAVSSSAMLLILAASWLALRAFDEPVRAWLSSRSRSRGSRRLPV